jgi:hypothetical protein
MEAAVSGSQFPPFTDFVLIPTAPAPPTGISSVVAKPVVHMTWQPSPGATDYIIEAGHLPGTANYFNGSVGNVTSITATVPPGRYYVRLRARNAAGVSGPSVEVVIDVAS